MKVFVGIILLVIGVSLFFVQKQQRHRARSVQLARSVTVAELQRLAGEIANEIGGGNWRDYIKLSGLIRCDRPLTSELKQEACVHYQMSVTREYEATVTKRDSQGKSHRETERGSETIASNQRSQPFYLEDATGRIEVNPDGAQIETIKVLNDFRQEAATGGVISYGGFSVVLGQNPSDRRTLGYRYSESILPVDQRVLVVGMLSDSSGSLIVQKPIQSSNQFIIALKDEEALTAQASNTAQAAFYGMIGCSVAGIILLAIALIA
jgi:uncharacterized membrane protein